MVTADVCPIISGKIVDYKTSKTDKNISTIRHGFNMLKRSKELAYIRKKVINEKSFSDLDNDFFADDFDNFLTAIEAETIVEKIHNAFNALKPNETFQLIPNPQKERQILYISGQSGSGVV